MFNVIKRNSEISELFNTGRYISTKTFSVIWINSEATKVAFIAGKKLGKAYIRNYYKRRLREIYRQNSDIFKNKKVLLIAKNSLLNAKNNQVYKGIKKVENIFRNKETSN